MTTVVGTIPEKISYVCAAPRMVKVGCYWDMSEITDDQKINVYPTFAVETGNPKTILTATKWADNNNSFYDYKNSKWETFPEKTHTDIIDNKPIDNIKLLSLETRSQGGRAYKILVNDKYYLDMREDVIVDVLLTEGIIKGVLQGKYIWVNIRGLKLVRIGSKLYDLLKDSDSKKDLPVINKKDLKVGGVYRNRRGDEEIFLGFINTYAMSYKNKLKFDYKLIKKLMLFFTGNSNKLYTNDSNYYLELKSTHNNIEHVKDIEIVDDPVEFWRNHYISYIKHQIVEYANHRVTLSSLQGDITYYSTKINMVKADEPLKKFDPNTLINFI